MIEFNKNDFADLLDTEYEDPSHSLDHKLTEILAKHDLEWDKDSKEYKALKEAHKYVRRNYLQDWLKCNKDFLDFSFLQNTKNNEQLYVVRVFWTQCIKI